MPDFGDHLRCCGVSKVETLNESEDAGRARRFLDVSVASFDCVAKERCISEGKNGLPVPLPWVPWELLNEPCFKYPIG